jgi:hypothetical protein
MIALILWLFVIAISFVFLFMFIELVVILFVGFVALELWQQGFLGQLLVIGVLLTFIIFKK